MKSNQILTHISKLTGKTIRRKFGMNSCGGFYVHNHKDTIEILVWKDDDDCDSECRKVWTPEQVSDFVTLNSTCVN